MTDADGNPIEAAPRAEMKVYLGIDLPEHAILRRERGTQ
jgi:hypothetical protein